LLSETLTRSEEVGFSNEASSYYSQFWNPLIIPAPTWVPYPFKY
jgi:hypothetical protein